jgi:hypothetical protein
MTTTYDTELNADTVAAPAVSEPTESLYACYDDADTYTISAAWASSPLGEPDDQINDRFDAVDEPKSPTSRAALAAALAAGIIGGATLGAVLFGYADPGRPTFVVPWGAVKTSPSQEIATPSSPPAPAKPAAIAGRVPKPAEQASVPKPIVSEPKTNPEVVPAPVDPGTPPVSAPPVIVDVFIPPLPPLGDLPEPPAPEPPKLDPPKIDVVQVPQPDPIPPKGQLNDDLLPKPQRVESLMPDSQKPQLQRQSEPNSSRFNVTSKP